MSLQSLQSRLSSLQGQERELKQQLQKSKKRLDEIVALIKSLSNIADENYSGVNQHNTTVYSGFSAGLFGTFLQKLTIEQIQEDREGDHSRDTNVSNALDQLLTEKRNIERKIDELEGQLAACQNNISSTKSAIAREKERIRAEERRRREAEREKARQSGISGR